LAGLNREDIVDYLETKETMEMIAGILALTTAYMCLAKVGPPLWRFLKRTVS
jgi:hypothetical protein